MAHQSYELVLRRFVLLRVVAANALFAAWLYNPAPHSYLVCAFVAGLLASACFVAELKRGTGCWALCAVAIVLVGQQVATAAAFGDDAGRSFADSIMFQYYSLAVTVMFFALTLFRAKIRAYLKP